MSGFTKLFSSLVHSTIWREPNHRRIVWVTMLAMKDHNGVVEASVPGLADAARVTLDEVLDALEHFQKPDKWSRNEANEGRRITKVDGGWFVLNHEYYRNLLSLEDKRAKDAERKRVQRASRNVQPRPETSESVLNVAHTYTDPNTDQIHLGEGAAPPAPPAKKSKRGPLWHFVPDDWKPTEAHKAKAKAKGLPWDAFEAEVVKFKNWEFKTPKSDANRAFTNWLASAMAQQGPKSPRGGVFRPEPSPGRPAREVLAEMARERL